MKTMKQGKAEAASSSLESFPCGFLCLQKGPNKKKRKEKKNYNKIKKKKIKKR